MKLKVQNVMDAMLALTAIINGQRAMPQLGKYKLARLHARLLPEFKVIDGRRDEMIKAYNNPQTRLETTADDPIVGHEVPVEGQWQVPADKMPEFTAAWKLIAEEEIDVDIQPISISSLSLPDSDGAIESHELIALGDFVTE